MSMNDIDRVLITDEQIRERAKQIGEEISKDYEGKCPILVGLLRGSVPFMAELMKYITVDCTTEYMQVSSYSGTVSTNEIKIIKDIDTSISNEDVIIIEDIVDTGATLKEVVELFEAKGAKSIKIASLLNKQARRECDIEADYVGFEVDNLFVVGYGLDFNQKYRNLPFVGVLKEECYKEC